MTKQEVETFAIEVGEEIIFTLDVRNGKPVAKVKGRKGEIMSEADANLAKVGPGPHIGLIKSYNEGKGFGFLRT